MSHLTIQALICVLTVPSLACGQIAARPGLGYVTEVSSSISLVGLRPPYAFAGFCALEPTDLWSVGGLGHIQLTSADGEPRKAHPTNSALTSVFFATPRVGWVVGYDGAILKTIDKGSHWQQQESGIRETLHSINCVDTEHCWAVGTNGIILRTLDGGASWRNVPSGTDENLYGVEFLDSQEGWVVGADSILLHTWNGGENWEESRLPGEEDHVLPKRVILLKSVRFVDQKHGWVAGNGCVARTDDGGQTWVLSLLDKSFLGIVAHDPWRAWVVGAGGTNYFTEDAGQSWQPVPLQGGF